MNFLKSNSRTNKRTRFSHRTRRIELEDVPLKKALREVTCIRNRARLTETMNESEARRHVAQQIALEKLKNLFGKKLKAVLIVGSAQKGVSKATLKKGASAPDLDLVVVLDPRGVGTYAGELEASRMVKAIKWIDKAHKRGHRISGITERFGFNIHFQFYFSEEYHDSAFGRVFGANQFSIGAAFQPIYGHGWLLQHLPQGFIRRRLPELLAEQLHEPKYASRP